MSCERVTADMYTFWFITLSAQSSDTAHSARESCTFTVCSRLPAHTSCERERLARRVTASSQRTLLKPIPELLTHATSAGDALVPHVPCAFVGPVTHHAFVMIQHHPAPVHGHVAAVRRATCGQLSQAGEREEETRPPFFHVKSSCQSKPKVASAEAKCAGSGAVTSRSTPKSGRVKRRRRA